ncbi:hypothetical protein [Actinoplanes nipponensis]|uniref:hypothetical protein n=1 Tax=Actinoplanes nipponensis TaxID=135950 RepID=UPI00194430B6|nr:hypothetical protein [Actinoplanes nipponensis]
MISSLPGSTTAVGALRNRLLHFADKSSKRADEALKNASPKLLLDEQVMLRALRATKPVRAFATLGFNRFLWIFGAAASGMSTERRFAVEYFDAAVGWFAAEYCMQTLIEIQEGVPIGVALNGGSERLRRLSSTDVHFSWVSELILSQAADEIAENPKRYKKLAGMTRPIVQELFTTLRGTSYRLSPVRPLSKLSPAAAGLLDHFCIQAGALSGTPFANLALSTTIEKHPFVRFPAGPAPLALRDSLMSLEQAFFEYSRRELADEKARGDLFERVTSRCIKAVMPNDFTELPPPLNIPIPNSRDEGEIDLAFSSKDDMLLIGECKAYFFTSGSDTITNAFEDQIKKAVKQLVKRVDAARQGVRIHSAGRPLSGISSSLTAALGIPLHPYGAAVWNSDALREVDGIRPYLAIIPLHQLLIVMQSIRDSADLRDYLILRHQIQKANTVVADEIDMLILHLNHFSRAGIQRRISSVQADERPFLLPCRFTADGTALKEIPRNRNAWRKWLYDSADVDRSIGEAQ